MNQVFDIQKNALDLITVQDVVRFGASAFARAGLVYGHGTTTAVEEAIFITLETLHLPIDDPDTFWQARLIMDERIQVLEKMAQRIQTRFPAPYIVGRAYIRGYGFHVTPDVIIPRSYLGEILMSGRIFDFLPFAEDTRPVKRILDLCTGSGCLAILAAHIFPQAHVDAVDLSDAALGVARRNVQDYGFEDRIALIKGDLFDSVKKNRYDLIITNPPYVGEDSVSSFPPEYQAEPVIAHLGGKDGMDIVRRILDQVSEYLTPQGGLLSEIGTGRSIIESEYPDLPLEWIDTETAQAEVFWYRP